MRNLRNLILFTRKVRKMPFYAVANGKKVGIFSTWDECKLQVNGYSGAKYKKFNTKPEAERYLETHGAKLPVKEVLQDEDKPKEVAVEEQKVPFVDYWPDDVSDGEEDDYLLAAVASKLDPERKVKDPKSKQPAAKRDVQNDTLKKLRKDSFVYDVVEYKTFANQQFPVTPDGYVLVYTDGSCEGNGTPDAVAGLGVYFEDDHPLNLAKPVTGRATNNCGEIQAAYQAILIADRYKIDKLCINTDSQFLINAATLWVRGWKRKSWKLSDGKPVKNREDFSLLDAIMHKTRMQIRWNYVKGHAGIKGNEGADQLARKGASLYRVAKRMKPS